jgi:hypothetical protein
LEENNHKFPQVGISTSKEDFEAHENLQQLIVVVPNEDLVEDLILNRSVKMRKE